MVRLPVRDFEAGSSVRSSVGGRLGVVTFGNEHLGRRYIAQ